jgi:peptidoglycan lytic transglycosylase F
MRLKKTAFVIAMLGIWIVGVCTVFLNHEVPEPPEPVSTLDRILEAGEITVITQNNSNGYYIYRDQEMGFEYDLAKAFAEFLGVKLKVNLAEKWHGMVPALLAGKGDFIAANLTITKNRQNKALFSNSYLSIQHHLVVHRNNQRIRTVGDLSGKTVHVRKGTSYQERLETLKGRGVDFELVLHDDLPTAELVRKVSLKDIDVTVAGSNIAMLYRRYYPRLVVADPICQKEDLGWAVNPQAKELIGQINAFFKKIKKDGSFEKIYNRYYGDIDRFDYVDLRTFHRRLKTRLPRYSRIIKEAARRYGFDWRLIAAQMYQESHFDPLAKSHAGASGLMQLTNATAASLGVNKILHPVENIYAGVRHLKNLYNHFDEATGRDRMYFALAAYNIGQGHLRDAQRLAASLGYDPSRWSSLARALPLLSHKKYYKNARYGYCRGSEPVTYINQVMVYYDILRQQAVQYLAKNGSQKAVKVDL